MRHTFRYLARERLRPGATLTLGPDDSHHLARVVRRRAGDPLELIDGAGGLWSATVVAPGPPATVRVGEARPGPAVAPLMLAQGLLDGGRLALVVEKAAELGVERVVVFASERVRRAPGADEARRRLARLERVAEAAARQAGHGRMTAVEGLVPFLTVLDELDADEAYLIDARGDAGLTTALGTGSARRALLVGPEAGFAPGEVAAARARGLRVCRLGPATLRAETAALAAMTLALAAAGRFAEGAG